MKTKLIKVSNGDSTKYDDCPFPLTIIPNNMGINLCAVESVSWTAQEDGQLVNIIINFIPDNDMVNVKVDDGDVPDIVYVCGKSFAPDAITGPEGVSNVRQWEIQGIYDREIDAINACKDYNDFVGPFIKNVAMPAETSEWPNAYFPKAKIEEVMSLHTDKIIPNTDNPANIFNGGLAGSLETWMVGAGKYEHVGIVQNPGHNVEVYINGARLYSPHEKIPTSTKVPPPERTVAVCNGGDTAITVDDGCYIIKNLRFEEGEYKWKKSPWIFPEALAMLLTLPKDPRQASHSGPHS